MRTTSNFALLDVKRGRRALRNLVKDHKVKIPVTVEGFITCDGSGDDGTSIEFEIAVTKHKLGTPIKIKINCGCVRCEAAARNPAAFADRKIRDQLAKQK